MTEFWVMYAPKDCWLALLLQGWLLPFIVEPMPGSHGQWSILLEKPIGN